MNQNIKDGFDIFFRFVTAFAAIVAFITYRRSVRIKRIEWLHSFSEKFYKENTYKEIRAILDYPEVNDEQYKILRGAAEKVVRHESTLTRDEINQIEKLVDYLNFFEFMGSLVELKEIKTNEVNTMFGYYLRVIKRTPWLHDFLNHESFQQIQILLRSEK